MSPVPTDWTCRVCVCVYLYLRVDVFGCVRVCVFIKLHVTAPSGPVILLIVLVCCARVFVSASVCMPLPVCLDFWLQYVSPIGDFFLWGRSYAQSSPKS